VAVRNAPRARRRRGAAIIVAFVLAGIGLVAVVLAGIAAIDDGGQTARRGDGLRPANVGQGTPVPQPPALATGLDLSAWSAHTAARSGVPARALRAYAVAELAQRVKTPACRLSWTTLAAIGRVESDHGRLGRANLDPDGMSRPSIVGVPLDGSQGVREIRDTDSGRFDGDTTYDRAVGPMQFLPTTWDRYGADGNGDDVRDPFQIDDAAAGAAAYLCAGGRDTASGAGWWAGVMTYNRSVSYARLVWAAADRYAGAVAP
jgi:membrane-bound lytic murein transglycosylase B